MTRFLRNSFNYLGLWLALWSSFGLSAQSITQNAYSILFRNGVYNPEENRGQITLSEGREVFTGYIQFYEIPSYSQRKSWEKQGLYLGSYIKNRAYSVSITASQLPLLRTMGIRSVFEVPSHYKIDPLLQGVNDEVTVWVSLNSTVLHSVSVLAIRAKDFIITYGYPDFNMVEVVMHGSRVSELASIPEVVWVQQAPPENVTTNLPGLVQHRANLLNQTAPGFRGLTGKGVHIGEWDGAGVGNHIDYDDRLTNVEPFVPGTGGNHATHVCGTFAGAGNLNEFAKGMAHQCKVFAWDFIGNVTMEMDTGIINHPFVITQNSYGYNPAGDPCTVRGRYDINSYGLDVLVGKHPYLLHVYANGNSRSSNCIAGGYRTVGSGYQSAKNVLTVGATTHTDGNSNFHSYGPALDGRLKPDVSGVGVNVFSTYPNNTFNTSSGTSMACPGVSGTAALLYEHYRNLNSGLDPLFHTIKATLCNTARDLGRKGPDFMYGYGRIDGDKSASVLERNWYRVDSLEHQDSFIWSVTVHPDSVVSELRVFLCWHDVPALSSAGTAIVNDLDLQVITPQGDTLLPWVPDFTNVTAVAQRRRDTLNLNEQVVIENPVAGDYKLIVLGREVPDGKPSFTLTYWKEKPGIRVTHPFGGERWAPPSTAGSARIITWDSEGVTGTFLVEFSADSGQTWQTLASGLSSTTSSFIWQTAADTLHTTRAFVRVTEQGGNGLVGTHPTTFTIMPHPQIVGPDAIACSERLTLFWDGHADFLRYEVSMLRNGTMEPIGTTSDTFFVVHNLQNDSGYWFAVTPINREEEKGRRSLARRHVPGGDDAPDIQVQPLLSVGYCSGDPILIFSEALGTPQIGNQWEYTLDSGVTWLPIANQESDTLSMEATLIWNTMGVRNAYYNHCGGFEYTDTLYTRVDTSVVFTEAPQDVILCEGEELSLEVSPQSYHPPSFYWEMATDQSPDFARIAHSDSVFQYTNDSVLWSQTGSQFRVLAQNFCGSFYSPEALLIVRPPLGLEVSEDTVLCTGQTALLWAQAKGGDTLNYEWVWQPTLEEGAQIVANPDQSTRYVVTLYDACSQAPLQDSVWVQRREPLTLEMPHSDTLICIGSSLEIEAWVQGGLTDSIRYFDLENREVAPRYTTTLTEEGFVGFRVEDGCSEEQPQEQIWVGFLDPLRVEIDAIDTLCVGQSVVLLARAFGGLESAHHVEWEQQGFNDSEFEVWPRETQAFSVLLTDGCTVIPDSASITVWVRAPLALELSGPDGVCPLTNIAIQAQAQGGIPNQYAYNWTGFMETGSELQDQPEATTEYRVVLSDGCSETADALWVVEVFPNPNLDFEVSPTVLCQYEEAGIVHNNRNLAPIVSSQVLIGEDYNIENNLHFNQVFHNPGMFSYAISLTDANGCSSDTILNDVVEVVAMPHPDFTFVPEHITIAQPLVTFTNTSRFADYVEWDFGEGSTSTSSSQGITYYDTGFYTVTLRAFNRLGCDSLVEQRIQIRDIYIASVPNAFSPDDNLLNEVWKPTIRGVQDYKVQIYNRWGDLVYQSDVLEEGWNGRLFNTGEPLPEGVYTYIISIRDINNEPQSESGTLHLFR